MGTCRIGEFWGESGSGTPSLVYREEKMVLLPNTKFPSPQRAGKVDGLQLPMAKLHDGDLAVLYSKVKMQCAVSLWKTNLYGHMGSKKTKIKATSA